MCVNKGQWEGAEARGRKTFPINESVIQPVDALYAIPWLLRKNSLPRVTVYNHENVTKTWNSKSTWGKDRFHRLWGESRLGLTSAFPHSKMYPRFRVLALRTADEERIDCTQSRPSEWNPLNGWNDQPPSLIAVLITECDGVHSSSPDGPVNSKTILPPSSAWLCASKDQLAYRREEKWPIQGD